MSSQRGWRSWWCWKGCSRKGKSINERLSTLRLLLRVLIPTLCDFGASWCPETSGCTSRVAVALLVGGGAEFSPLSITSLQVLQHSRSQHQLWVLLWFLVLAWPLSFIQGAGGFDVPAWSHLGFFFSFPPCSGTLWRGVWDDGAGLHPMQSS